MNLLFSSFWQHPKNEVSNKQKSQKEMQHPPGLLVRVIISGIILVWHKYSLKIGFCRDSWKLPHQTIWANKYKVIAQWCGCATPNENVSIRKNEDELHFSVHGSEHSLLPTSNSVPNIDHKFQVFVLSARTLKSTTRIFRSAWCPCKCFYRENFIFFFIESAYTRNCVAIARSLILIIINSHGLTLWFTNSHMVYAYNSVII